MDEKEIQKQLSELKDNVTKEVAQKAQEQVQKAKEDLEKSIKAISETVEKGSPDKIKEIVTAEMKTVNEALESLKTWQKDRGPIEAADREAIDNMLSELKAISKNSAPKNGKSFGEVFSEAMAKKENIEAMKSVRKGNSFMLELPGVTNMSAKSVANMTLGNNLLSGDSVISYSPQQAFLPSQKVNIRDLVRTVHSDTGIYVHYKESAAEGSIGNQTEGSSKAQIDFDMTEVQTVNKYVSGFTRFSKQLAKSLPFFQGTLPTLLLREFFKQENGYFKSKIAAAATGSTTTSETDDVKQIIDYVANQRAANYNVDFVMVSHASQASLQKLTYANGYYQGSGGVMVLPSGTLTISGVPIIPASWMNDAKVLLIDSDYVERIEVESLRVEFFEQDADNVTKNLITARIECYEEINPMLGPAFTYANL